MKTQSIPKRTPKPDDMQLEYGVRGQIISSALVCSAVWAFVKCFKVQRAAMTTANFDDLSDDFLFLHDTSNWLFLDHLRHFSTPLQRHMLPKHCVLSSSQELSAFPINIINYQFCPLNSPRVPLIFSNLDVPFSAASRACDIVPCSAHKANRRLNGTLSKTKRTKPKVINDANSRLSRRDSHVLHENRLSL